MLVYVDDDNLLAADYLEAARALLAAHPFLGVIGAGVLEPEYEVQPSAALLPYVGCLALRTVIQPRWSISIDDWVSVPWGAGLCVARDVATAYLDMWNNLSTFASLERQGEHFGGEGDVAFSLTAVQLGRGFGIFPRLRVTHLIRSERLTRRHFLRLVHDRYFSSGVFGYLRTGERPDPARGTVERHIRTLLHGARRGVFAMRMRQAMERGLAKASALIDREQLKSLEFGHSTHPKPPPPGVSITNTSPAPISTRQVAP
jgi:hypothetical protein